MKYVRDENGALEVKEDKVMERWRSYFFSLLNTRDKREPTRRDR